MLLDSVLENKATVATEGAEIDMSDALLECAVGIEEAYGDMMVEQAKCEFKQYVNEGKIDSLNEGILDSVKNFFKKLWNFIKKYYNKLKTWITGLNKNAYQYFQTNQKKIESNINSVSRFYGYSGLTSFNNIEAKTMNIIKTIGHGQKLIGSYVDLAKNADKSGSNSNQKSGADDNIKEFLNTMKKEIVGNSASTEESFTSILKDDIRGSSKETEVKYSFAEIKNVVGSEAAVKCLALELKKLESVTKDLENNAYGIAHQENEADRSGRAVNLYTQLAKLLSTACTTVSGMIPAVVKQADRYQRAVVNGKSDDERKNEDADMTVDEAKAYLESIGIA